MAGPVVLLVLRVSDTMSSEDWQRYQSHDECADQLEVKKRLAISAVHQGG